MFNSITIETNNRLKCLGLMCFKVYPIRVTSSVRDASVHELSFLFSKITPDLLERFGADQKRRLLQDKLEKLYSPIMNNLDHINNAPFDFRHPKYPDYAEFFRGIRANVHLASEEFRPLLEEFLATVDGRRSRKLLTQARNQMLKDRGLQDGDPQKPVLG